MSKGFSLIEMMVVVVIIGIVSAIGVPAYNSYIEVAKVDECAREIAAIELAEEVFAAENLTYFAGADTEAIADASGGNYTETPRFANGTANCTIAVTAGPNGIATEYKITATGANDLDGKGEVKVKQNY